MSVQVLSEGAPSVSVCFPAYGEEATIAAVLEDASAMLAASGLDYEILICDDGSRDRTLAIARELEPRLPHLRVLSNPKNLGIRATFERLYAEARKDLVFLNSTDGQWPTRVLFELLPRIGEYDIVIASRREKHYGLSRRIVSSVFNRIPELLFGVRTHDAGAVKLVRREIIERLPLLSRSPFTEAERLIRASRAGYRVGAIDVDVAPRRFGRARGVAAGTLCLALGDVARVWWSLRKSPSK